MMNIISSIVNSYNVLDSAAAKTSSVSKTSFQNALQEERSKIRKISEVNSIQPYGKNETNDQAKYAPAAKKAASDNSEKSTAVIRNTAIINQIRLDTAEFDKEKIINPVKVKNAYHI